jgi:predicted aldo/keto reductase-like oxidoreductase
MTAVNIADRHTYDFERRVWPLAAKRNLGLVAMKVFGGADWKSKAMSNSLMPEARHDMAFRYALSLPHVSLAVIGMATEEELRENLARARAFTPLTTGERQSLETPGRTLADRWGAHFGPTV